MAAGATTTSPTKALTPFYRDLAKKEVGEIPEHVVAHLTSFKRSLSNYPHLKLPLRDDFLLSFLRYAHYNHSLAERRIDNFCTLRCTDSVASRWYDYPQLNDPVLDRYLSAGIFLPLGFLESGLYVVLIRLASWNPEEIDQLSMRTLNNMNFERLIFDQRCQIGGFCLLVDMDHTTWEQAKQWADLKEAKGAMKLMQEASPGRTKHLIFYKESKIFDFAFKLSEAWLSEKMRNRVLRVKDHIQKAFKKVPGLETILPVEYKGHNGTTVDAIERCRKELIDFYSKEYPLRDIQVDESKRPPSARNLIREYSTVGETSGTYVEFNVFD